MKSSKASKSALKLSQREWSKHLAVHHSTVCRWLRSAGIKTVRRTRDKGVTLEEILRAVGRWE